MTLKKRKYSKYKIKIKTKRTKIKIIKASKKINPLKLMDKNINE
jgi:hypothetical protein